VTPWILSKTDTPLNKNLFVIASLIIGKVAGFMRGNEGGLADRKNETGRRQLPAAYNHYTL
jgi:hypothetical protein